MSDDIRSAPSSSRSPTAQLREHNLTVFNKKRTSLLSDLHRSIDTLIYAQLIAQYYLDTRFLLLTIRCLLQFSFFTPKPSAVFIPPPARSVAGAAVLVLCLNLACVWMHAFVLDPASGTESSRGWVHGGLMIDFVGQEGPVSRLRIVSGDVLVALLQVWCCGIVVLRMRCGDVDAGGTGAVAVRQTVENEERGERADVVHRDGQAVELQDLNADGQQVPADSGEREGLLSAAAEESDHDGRHAGLDERPRTDAFLFDAFNSGQAVIGHFDLVKIIREQWALARTKDELQDTSTAGSADTAAGAGTSSTRRSDRFRALLRFGFNLRPPAR